MREPKSLVVPCGPERVLLTLSEPGGRYRFETYEKVAISKCSIAGRFLCVFAEPLAGELKYLLYETYDLKFDVRTLAEAKQFVELEYDRPVRIACSRRPANER